MESRGNARIGIARNVFELEVSDAIFEGKLRGAQELLTSQLYELNVGIKSSYYPLVRGPSLTTLTVILESLSITVVRLYI